ncbi:MAG TPA: hypothetical protein VFT98_12500 [Myxococcota bacterium]|nr:hypothetical protein [Myxococcota bacterium]
MSRAIGIAFAFVLALGADATRADEDRSAYDRAQSRLTEQLNTVIAEGVELGKSAPPAKPDDAAEKQTPASGAGHEPLARR